MTDTTKCSGLHRSQLDMFNCEECKELIFHRVGIHNELIKELDYLLGNMRQAIKDGYYFHDNQDAELKRVSDLITKAKGE